MAENPNINRRNQLVRGFSSDSNGDITHTIHFELTDRLANGGDDDYDKDNSDDRTTDKRAIGTVLFPHAIATLCGYVSHTGNFCLVV